MHNTVMTAFKIDGSVEEGWTAEEYSTSNYCSGKTLEGVLTGGYIAIGVTSIAYCSNPWSYYPYCSS